MSKKYFDMKPRDEDKFIENYLKIMKTTNFFTLNDHRFDTAIDKLRCVHCSFNSSPIANITATTYPVTKGTTKCSMCNNTGLAPIPLWELNLGISQGY